MPAPKHRTLCLTFFAVTLSSVASSAQLPDTIRVGSMKLFPLAEGVDTMDVAFESRSANGTIEKRANVSVSRRVIEQLNGESVLHVRFGGNSDNRYDFYLDPHTLVARRFEQRTNVDSAVVTFRDGCASGWVDLQNNPRRTLTCDRVDGRYSAGPLDEYLVALLPLKAGMHASLATYGPVGNTLSGFTFTVVASEPLTLDGKRFQTWRVERVVKSDYGTYTTTLWVDQQKHRILQISRDFGNGRGSVSTLRNR
jgi:hypothetical protein